MEDEDEDKAEGRTEEDERKGTTQPSQEEIEAQSNSRLDEDMVLAVESKVYDQNSVEGISEYGENRDPYILPRNQFDLVKRHRIKRRVLNFFPSRVTFLYLPHLSSGRNIFQSYSFRS